MLVLSDSYEESLAYESLNISMSSDGHTPCSVIDSTDLDSYCSVSVWNPQQCGGYPDWGL